MAGLIESALPGIEVRLHDDGSKPGMYDFDLFRMDHHVGICEVTSSTDGDSIALWNLMNGGETWIESTLAGGWLITLTPKARAREIKDQVPARLRELEELGVRDVDAVPTAAARLRSLGVSSARQSGTNLPGSIYVTIFDREEAGFMVDETGGSLVNWLDGWLVSPARADNLKKLSGAGPRERHLAVVMPGFTTAHDQVAYLLMSDDAEAPAEPPRLPEPVTTIWLVSTWSTGSLFCATSDGWSRFPKPNLVQWPSRKSH